MCLLQSITIKYLLTPSRKHTLRSFRAIETVEKAADQLTRLVKSITNSKGKRWNESQVTELITVYFKVIKKCSIRAQNDLALHTLDSTRMHACVCVCCVLFNLCFHTPRLSISFIETLPSTTLRPVLIVAATNHDKHLRLDNEYLLAN